LAYNLLPDDLWGQIFYLWMKAFNWIKLIPMNDQMRLSENKQDKAVKDDRILALIPAYNEHQHIAAVVSLTHTYLPVLVVDDGSADETSQLARESGAVVLRQEPNQGKGAAMARGFTYALENGYEAVITLDGDGQHDPAEIPEFVTEFNSQHSDLIIGERDFRQMPFVRMCSNTLGTWMFSGAMRQYIPDNQSGYRLISANLMKAMLASQNHGFEFEVEMILRCVLEKQKLSWIRIETIYAGQNSHIQPLKHAWRFFLITISTSRIVRVHLKQK
jgi:glycosyltransferase involved in cell wall biosynthesis